VTVTVTPYRVDMGQSLQEFDHHVSDCNLDFKENVLRKVQTIKLSDTSELNKKVEELKTQEASDLAHLNKGYLEVDMRCKKLEKKVSLSNKN